MSDAYGWVKVVHVLAVISWMAGLFYLPRLFVYHAENEGKYDISPVFKVMERRLLKAIMRPAALVAVVTGAMLIHLGGWELAMPVWLWLKLLLVLGMLGFHGLLEVHAARFRDDRETRSGRYFRIINEIPTLLLIGIVILVIIKPF
ncbi:protoporphyrinogen oxidase HemJ [Aestuariivirga litoralis]|uniref:Protoporphyrinogen IX oxidase n=1 Tax=Aestuariivirga litoralis TaxID=2650924 RepID=A0A2W2BVC2_9HYPH|nr:protoporphyrinogen oxidase HemJ [Aestuariivirga litoralis]PZF77426.1 protoporphyrinogen oxidase HemJ [Aestuariivirga litoralis]